MKVGELYQTADWKAENHLPVIEGPETVKADEMFEVKVSIGKEISHPNTTAHHIRWIQVFLKPEGDKFAYQVATCEFTAHGESVEGPDTGPVYTHHETTVALKIKKPGVLVATSLCNIQGLWESGKTITIS
jgi:superoxide reductase